MRGQGGPQPGHAGKGAAGQRVALQGAEPVLDRVQPGRVGRGEVEVAAGVGLAPSFHLAVPVGGVVVQEQAHLPGGETPGPLLQEGQEFLVPVSRSKAAGRVKVPWRTWSRVPVAVWTVVAGRSVCVRSRACLRGLASTDSLTTPGFFFEHGNHVLQLGLEAGSSDSLQVRTRCGWMPASRHQRWMRVGEKPVALAIVDYRRARNAAARRAHAQRRRKYCEYLFRQYEVSLHHQAVDDTVRGPRASCAAGRGAGTVSGLGRTGFGLVASEAKPTFPIGCVAPSPPAAAGGRLHPEPPRSGIGSRRLHHRTGHTRPPLNRETDGTIAGGNGPCRRYMRPARGRLRRLPGWVR